jgi:HD-like signal output (HDOD) protein
LDRPADADIQVQEGERPMDAAISAHQAELQLAGPETDALVKNIGIPPRPATLLDLQTEIAKEDPDLRRVARLVASDVALTAAMLRIVNSPAYALPRRCETADQAITMLGLKQVSVLVTGLMLRKVLRTDGPQLTRFWDVSGKRSFAVSRLARGLRGVDVDIAQSFGLFCDVGIPLLMQRFPDYGKTLKACNDEPARSFTEVEQAELQTDHALIGAIMARSWGISQTVCMAIRLHHDYAIFRDPRVPESVTRLVAMGLVAEVAIQRFARLNSSTEWSKGGDCAAGALMLGDEDVEEWIERLLEEFALGTA